MRASLGRPMARLGFELFLVFVAVTAALFANAWWQDRQAAADGRAALAAFAAEMRANCAQIQERLDQHRAILANTTQLLQDVRDGKPVPHDVLALRQRVTDGKGMRTPLLSRAAWDSALASRALSRVSFDVVRRIAAVYEVQQKLETLLDQLLQNFTEPSYFEQLEATATALMVTYSMIIELEVEQVAAYDRCAELLTGQ